MNQSCEIVAPVFQEYRSILARYIRSRVSDAVDSEELLSEVMMKIYKHCEKLEGVRNTQAWLITIARNTINDYFREKQKRKLAVPGSWAYLALAQDDNEGERYLHELEACVPSLINKLPPKYAKPLADYELRGIPQKTLAVQYNMSESGLKSRVQRGRKMLKGLFKEYCGHLIEEREGCSDCSC
ncbi:MAG: sigma-70 family RNA polymerase sigma factor [Cyclobacteriaceae bacterium]